MAIRCEITGRGVLFGNNVSHAKNRTRTTWAPNLHKMKIYSQKLGFISIKLSNRGLRTIQKHGGFDEYLRNTPNRKLTNFCMRIKNKHIKIS